MAAQQCFSKAQGLFLPLSRLIDLKRIIPTPAARLAGYNACRPLGPPNTRRIAASEYHNEPSPRRVEHIIHRRTQRGGRQRWTLRISR